jgi:hypothetical protein
MVSFGGGGCGGEFDVGLSDSCERLWKSRM